jgi:hypothetical protein
MTGGDYGYDYGLSEPMQFVGADAHNDADIPF